MGDLQDPKMEVLYHFSGHILGDIPWKIGLKNRPFFYGRYLRPQSDPGSWPLILFSIIYGIVIPTDFHMFQRGRYSTNQSCNGHWFLASPSRRQFPYSNMEDPEENKRLGRRRAVVRALRFATECVKNGRCENHRYDGDIYLNLYYIYIYVNIYIYIYMVCTYIYIHVILHV